MDNLFFSAFVVGRGVGAGSILSFRLLTRLALIPASLQSKPYSPYRSPKPYNLNLNLI